MSTSRLEAFSDGVLAIIITIMVLELNIPDGTSLQSLWQGTGLGLLSYLLSFIYVGIYWNNHHHLLQVIDTVTGAGLWANLNLLFWLSLLPLTTAWADATHFAPTPLACYGVVLLASALAYLLLQRTLVRGQPVTARARPLVQLGCKGGISLGVYTLGALAAMLGNFGLPDYLSRTVAIACYVGVALLWLIPDRRLEHAASHQ